MDLFKIYKTNEIIETTYGRIVNNKMCISMLPIYSKLIKEVGTSVEHYCSDILYDIKDIENYICNYRKNSEKNKNFWIGLRQNGVDNEVYISVKIENKDHETYYKILLLHFDIDTKNDCVIATLSLMKKI